MTRRYKIVDAAGRTANCATHDMDEAARALLDARAAGTSVTIRTGTGHQLPAAAADAIVARAVEIHNQRSSR